MLNNELYVLGKTKKPVPSWWYVLLLFIPILRATVLTRQRTNVSDYTAIDIWAIIDICTFFITTGVVLIHLPQIPWKKINRSCFKWWLLYYVFCFFSFTWRIPGSSISYICYRASSMLVMSLYTFWLMNQFQDKTYAFQKIIKYIFFISVFGILFAIRTKSFHTNSYSVSSAVAAIILLTEKWNINGKKYLLMLFCSIFFLFLGTSSGSNVAFACALLLLLIHRKKKLSLPLCLLTVVIGILVYHYALDSIIKYLMPGKTVQSMENMTGRVTMWKNYIEAWKLQPWLGYGFAVGERSGKLFDYIYCLSAHNGFISLLINTGIIGIAIWGMFFVNFMVDLFLKAQGGIPFAKSIFFAMVVIIINNLSIPIIGSQWGPLSQTALFLISYVILFMDDRENRVVQPKD